MELLTICTPTYNRADLLERPFKSLMAQTCKRFIWLIIDDGSTDNTKQVVDGFKQEADFPVVYVYQINKGKAAALNNSYNYIQTEYVMNLDSDDEFVPDAVQKVYDVWKEIPKEEYDRFWCISGQCIDSKTKEIIGGTWPKGINELKGRKQHKVIIKHKKGEKCCCRKVAILRENLFPQYDDTKFVPEDIVWERINNQYDQYCTNEVFRVYYSGTPNSLSNRKKQSIELRCSGYYYSVFTLNHCFYQFFYNKWVRTCIPYSCRTAILSNKGYYQLMKDLNGTLQKVLVSACWVPMMIYCHFK